MPAMPPPTIRTFLGRRAGRILSSASRPASGFTAQLIAVNFWIRPMQPSWQEMHGRMCSGRPARSLFT